MAVMLPKRSWPALCQAWKMSRNPKTVQKPPRMQTNKQSNLNESKPLQLEGFFFERIYT
jgi:hypothetical protein